jgi:putative membrane protein
LRHAGFFWLIPPLAALLYWYIMRHYRLQNQVMQTLLNTVTQTHQMRMKRFTLFALAALRLAVFSACHSNNAGAADSSAADTSKITGDTVKNNSMPVNNDADAVFAREATIGGMAEIAMAKMALTKSGDNDIKNFADMMAVDHVRTTGELKNLLKTKSLPMPNTLDAPHRQTADSLDKLSATAFDKAYVKIMIDDHKKTLKLMQDEAQNGKDADLKAFAGRTSAIVQTHLDSILKIQQRMK